MYKRQLQTVPQDLIEAAVIDGAGKGQVFANITLPSIMSVIKTVTLTAIIGNFQMFTLFYNMTAGGPVRATTTLTVYTYETAFMSYDPVSYTHLSDVDIVRIAQRMFPPNSEYVSFSIPCRTHLEKSFHFDCRSEKTSYIALNNVENCDILVIRCV